jgi:hypothetical protein
MAKFQKTKQYLKDLIPVIREQKPYARHLSRDYRLNHVAYCLLRGTPYELIEQPRDENSIPNWLIEEYKKKVLEREAQDEAVCNSI